MSILTHVKVINIKQAKNTNTMQREQGLYKLIHSWNMRQRQNGTRQKGKKNSRGKKELQKDNGLFNLHFLQLNLKLSKSFFRKRNDL